MTPPAGIVAEAQVRPYLDEVAAVLHGTLTATATVAGLNLTGDLLIVGVTAHAGTLSRPCAVIAVATSLIRIGCGLHALAQARALRRRLSRGSPASPRDHWSRRQGAPGCTSA